MTVINEPTYINHIECDASKCMERFSVAGKKISQWNRLIWRDLSAAGWTTWAGRGRRHYCPSHEPQPGHKMRDVTERVAPR